MTKFVKSFAIALIAGLAFAFTAFAQTSTTGDIQGTVADQNGAVVPNASVSLEGGGLLNTKTTTSDSNGNYRFQQVPPGRYTLKVAASGGFDAYQQTNIQVNLDKTTTVDIALKPKGTTAQVDVVASPEIDQTSNSTGTSVSSDFFSNIPTARTVQSLYNIAPTVARSGLRDASGRDRDPSVAGSSGPENNYILDGVNTTDPAFGGGGANLPFEFVQEVQVKTGSYGADQGLSTGGVFNVITKAGTNEFHGDLFAYIGNEKLVRDTKNFPFTGLAPNGFSEIDAGGDIGGPIIKNKLTFFGAFNPQYRTNNYLTQTFRTPVDNKIQTPFYAGKVTWQMTNDHVFNFSTFGDFTKEEGHLFAGSGFGANTNSFRGTRETGGHNYAARLNSVFGQNMIGEFSFGVHRQRANVIPDASVANKTLITDNFAILRPNGTVASVTATGVSAAPNAGVLTLAQSIPATIGVGTVDYVFAPGGTLQRGFVRDGFGLFSDQARNRWEAAARLQNIFGRHTVKYGFEFYNNAYDISTISSGPGQTYNNPLGLNVGTGNNVIAGARVTNNFSVCTTTGTSPNLTLVCPNATAFRIMTTPGVQAGLLANGITSVVNGAITEAQALNNPFLVRASTRVRDFQLHAQTVSRTESFYVQDDIKVTPTFQLNLGLRWDYQQAYGNSGVHYLSLNRFFDNMQPRVGFSWDFTGKGKGKVFANFARYLETPIPLDVNVRAGSNDTQTDKNFNASTINAPLGATIATGIGSIQCTNTAPIPPGPPTTNNANCGLGPTSATLFFAPAVTTGANNLGAEATPIDHGLKPQTVNEWTAGFQYEVKNGMVLGVRGIYRPQGSVIEDGSFDDGDHYFLFNPGEIRPGDNTTEEQACADPHIGCFGRARRYYRALEFTFNKRFSQHYSWDMSYVFSSLIGNYEGLFRNDNGQSDPNITSLFDLVSLLNGLYGRLPNDRPHQFKFNGSYETPFKLMISGNFYVQSGIPFNMLVPHAVYGNNEGFGVPRGTALFPSFATLPNGAAGGIQSGTNRTPTTYNLDLGFYYPIKFSENMELRFTADWFNVTNTQRAVTVDNTFQINSGVTGVAPVTNPFWGTGTIFQYPSNLRFGAKFRF